jgi:hypothetical protein
MKLSICLTLAMVLLILITIHFKKDSDSEPTDYILLCDNFSVWYNEQHRLFK